MSKNNYNNNNPKGGQDLEAGLVPAIEMSELGRVYIESTQSIANKVVPLFEASAGIRGVDNIIITPRLSNDEVGVERLYATAYINVGQGSGIYYRGKGNSRRDSGRINILDLNGGNSGNSTGPFGMTDEFRSAIQAFCRIDHNGNPIVRLERVPNTKDVASIELDANKVLALALGVESKGNYDFSVLRCEPIPSPENNFNLLLYKYIYSTGVTQGRSKKVNYAAVSDDLLGKYNNNNGNNGGGRRNNRRNY